MTNQSPPPPSLRILAAFHPSTTSRTAIEAAVDFAFRLRAELNAMFIEDTDLLDLAEYPFLRQVFVIHSLYDEPGESVNDKLCRLLFFVGALRDASADRVAVLAPYLCYARKDRKTQTRDPVTTRHVASLFEAVDVDCVATIDVHNLATCQNAFRCRIEHLEARPLFARHVAKTCVGDDLVVPSPDVGGMKRAETFRRSLERLIDRPIGIGFMEKRRALGEVSGERLYAEVDGKSVVMIDDIIGSGTQRWSEPLALVSLPMPCVSLQPRRMVCSPATRVR